MPKHNIKLPDGTELTVITFDDRTTTQVADDLREGRPWWFPLTDDIAPVKLSES